MNGAKRIGWLRLFRRKPEPERRTVTVRIPDAEIEELARLYDAKRRADLGGTSRVESVALWRFLHRFAETATKNLPVGSTWNATLDWDNMLQPALRLDIEIPPPKEEPCPPPASPC